MIKIGNFNFFRRLRKKFDILDGGQTPEITIVPTIQPVVDAGKADRRTQVQDGNFDLSGAAGGYVTCYTVPSDEKWYLLRCFRSACVAVGGVHFYHAKSGFNVQLITPQTAAIYMDLERIELEPGDIFGVTATGNGGDNSENVRLYYEYEKISSE